MILWLTCATPLFVLLYLLLWSFCYNSIPQNLRRTILPRHFCLILILKCERARSSCTHRKSPSLMRYTTGITVVHSTYRERVFKKQTICHSRAAFCVQPIDKHGAREGRTVQWPPATPAACSWRSRSELPIVGHSG